MLKLIYENMYILNKVKEKKKSLCLNFLIKSFLYREVELIFIKNYNKIFIQENFLIIRFFFINVYFFKKINNIFSFLFINFKKFFLVFNNFFNIYNNMRKLYFFRLKLKGLGFILKRYSKFLFSFLMAVNHFYYFFISNNFLIKKKKKQIICLALNLSKLNILF